MSWDELGGRVASTPAVTTWAANEMQVFTIGPDGELSSIYWDGRAWHPWHGHGGSFVGSPAVCSWGADRIDVFARAADGTLMHQWYEPAGWSEWESLASRSQVTWLPRRGVRIGSICSGRSAMGALLHAWWDGSTWSFEP